MRTLLSICGFRTELSLAEYRAAKANLNEIERLATGESFYFIRKRLWAKVMWWWLGKCKISE